jgi:type III restriction enzyme
VEYKDSKGNLRLYYPDFAVKIDEKERLIIETKRYMEDVDVEYKDKRIRKCCEDAASFSGKKCS